ncbi:hypothetical protein M9Y10_018821 [Tritrichomonas musculus]|uniref:DUF3447 domain-containing protein n=1 Tax=Tritrichomonas musculus TaxID=1915356 RepID=A0ABR2HHT3_9EUKA
MEEFHILCDIQKLLVSIKNEDDIEDVKTFIYINGSFLTKTNTPSLLMLIASVVYANPHLFDAMVKLLSDKPFSNFITNEMSIPSGNAFASMPYFIIYQLLKCSNNPNRICFLNYRPYRRNMNPMDSIHSQIIDLTNPYIKAIYDDDVQKLQQLIILSNFDENQQMSIFKVEYIDSLYNNSILIEFAALFGSLQCFKYLFLNSKNVDYEDLLKYSIAGGNYDIIHITEDQIQDDEYKSKQIYLYLAIYYMRNELIEYLIDNYEVKIDTECYIRCLYSSNYEAFLILNEIDEDDYNIFGVDQKGMKPIEIASLYGYYYFVKLMVNMSNRMMQDCLYYATKGNNLDIVKIIIENNLGNPNYIIRNNYTPFDIARGEIFHYFSKHFQYHYFDHNLEEYSFNEEYCLQDELQMFEEYDIYEFQSFKAQIQKKNKIIRSKQKKKIIKNKKQNKN